MITRRGFLKALAGTILAPFIPAIAAAPAIYTLPFDDILSGKYKLFLLLGNSAGPIRSMGRQPIVFENGANREQISYTATETCTIDHGFLENEDGGFCLPFSMNLNTNCVIADDAVQMLCIVFTSN